MKKQKTAPRRDTGADTVQSEGKPAACRHPDRYVLLAVVLVIAGIVAWFLFRFEFYRDYEKSIRSAYTVPECTDFIEIREETNNVPGMKLAAQNDILKLYANPETGEVAVYDRRNGKIIRSNPENPDADPIANKTNKAYLKSQLTIAYYNANRNAGTYDSYSMSTARGQMTAHSLEDGVRFTYGIGEIPVISYYVPNFLTEEWVRKVTEGAAEKDAKNLIRMYTAPKTEGGLYTIIDTARNDNSKKKKVDAALQQVGFTQDDYYEMQTLGGEVAAETLFFNVSVDYRLNGDALDVSVPTELIEEKGGGRIYQIQLLRFMGAAGTDETGYFVVPDGSGALINFNNGKTTMPVYTQYIYDMDLVSADYTQTQNTQKARLPLCGICREDSSVLITVERGASLCYFTADVSGRTNSRNVIQPVFVVRGTDILTNFGVSGNGASVPIIMNDLYDENLTVRYSFLTGEYKGYAGLANYYRERLIREGKLTPKAQGGDIPFYYDIIGGVKETRHILGFQYLNVEPMTTFAQAGGIARELAEGGITRQVMNLQGWFNGGYYHDVPDRVRVLGSLGGAGGLNSLSAAVRALGGEVYPDAAFQFVTYISKRFNAGQESSRYYGAGYSVQIGQTNPANLRRTSSLGYDETISNLLSPKFLPRYVNAFADAVKKLDVDGISLRDLGDELHSDQRRTNIINREQARDITMDAFETLAASGKKLMVSGGNLYALENAAHVINAPMSAAEYFIIDEEIPLYQMILHGCADYAGTTVNQSSLPQEEIVLKCIEYGASCHYMFTERDATDMKYSGLNRAYATSFALWKDSAVSVYSQLNEALAPVSGAFMTDRDKPSEGVVRVKYSNGVILYVNYNDTDAQADGLTVPARGWAMGGEGL